MCLPVTPYKVEREWEHAGLKCAEVQAREAGHRCGYVRVPPGHPAHGKRYDALDVSVHGGLTFSQIEPCAHDDGTGYWFGFDCAHFMDARYDPAATPESVTDAEARAVLEVEMKFRNQYDRRPEHFWTQPEVERETEQLAEQLAALGESSKRPT